MNLIPGKYFLPLLFAGSLIISLSSCSSDSGHIPSGVIPADSMIDILANLHITESRMVLNAGHSGKVAIKSKFLAAVFDSLGVDTARFASSFEYYSEQPEILARIYDDVISEISRRQAGQ